MKFSEIDFMKIKAMGVEKTVVHGQGKLIVGGKLENILAYRDILKDKKVIGQARDVELWMIEIE